MSKILLSSDFYDDGAAIVTISRSGKKAKKASRIYLNFLCELLEKSERHVSKYLFSVMGSPLSSSRSSEKSRITQTNLVSKVADKLAN